ncbi:MAG TPA: F0F1 ATP synthase subunit A, partial [Candidatus Angelobacter sp.]|jgi:F-type H+-transporting ATPase subunit a|nr:F0F1 ATP synthase subunit A [Candidatus Angelobacter sp.]
MNLIGLIPTLESPTLSPAVPFGCALVAFFYYNLHGIKKQGPVKFVAHFAGPVWYMAPIIFPIEIISTLARVMSLTIRLYANIFAGDMVTAAFFMLLPIGLPVIFLGLHVAVSFLQAYIFTLLVTIYLGGVVAEEH